MMDNRAHEAPSSAFHRLVLEPHPLFNTGEGITIGFLSDNTVATAICNRASP
jgi:hypothetical protein